MLFNYHWLPIMDLAEDDAVEIKLSPTETDREQESHPSEMNQLEIIILHLLILSYQHFCFTPSSFFLNNEIWIEEIFLWNIESKIKIKSKWISPIKGNFQVLGVKLILSWLSDDIQESESCEESSQYWEDRRGEERLTYSYSPVSPVHLDMAYRHSQSYRDIR